MILTRKIVGRGGNESVLILGSGMNVIKRMGTTNIDHRQDRQKFFLLKEARMEEVKGKYSKI